MTYTVTDKVFLSGLVVLFLIIVIAGTFSAVAISAWMSDRRAERKECTIRMAQRNDDRRNAERNAWQVLLQEKDERISELVIEVGEWKRKYLMTSQLLETSEAERLKQKGNS